MPKTYDFVLYQRYQDDGLEPGLSTGCANFLNESQPTLKFDDLGTLRGVSLIGGPHYGAKQIRPPEKLLQSGVLSIGIVNLRFKDGFFSLGQDRIFVTRHMYPSSNGPLFIHYFSFMITVSTLAYYIRSLQQRHEEINKCPFDARPTTDNVVEMLRRGHLCNICEGRIEKHMKTGVLEESFLVSVRAILRRISNYQTGAELPPLVEPTNDKFRILEENQDSINSDAEIAEGAVANNNIDKAGQTLKAETGEYVLSGGNVTTEVSPPLVQPGAFGAKSDEETPIDALGYTDYAIALANVISDKQTGTPLTVAICAPWGRGKSVLMGFIEDQLSKVEKKDPYRKETTCIRVSAWEISKTTKVWAEFYSNVISQIVRSLSWWRKLWFRLQFRRTLYPWSFWFAPLIFTIGISLFLAWPIEPRNIMTNLFGITLPHWLTSSDDKGSLISLVVAILSLFTWLWKNVFGTLSQLVFRSLTTSSSKQKPGTEQEVLLNIDLVQQTFQKVSNKRIVVFVDDIDRASESKILQVLEAIKLFLHSKQFVFVLAMDTKVVRRAVGTHYKFAVDETTSKEDWGRSYLEKIIQIPFHLPHLTDEQRLDLCNSILEGYESSKDDNQMRTITSTVKTEGQEKESKFSLNDTNKQPEDEKSDQISDPEPVAESDRGTDNKDQSVDSYRGGLDPWELDIIKTISSQADLELSPRLLKRFINIYLVARQLLQPQQQHLVGKVAAPPENLTKWLALSVAFPFESKAFTSWLQTKHWLSLLGDNDGPFSQNGPFSNLGNFHWVVPIDGGTTREVPKPNTPFSGLDVERLSKFGKLFLSMGIDSKQLSKTHRISSCFNLVLD